MWSFTQLPIDATPDITNVQVQINTEAPGYSPLESEQRVTFPIETALAGLPRLDYTRSLSRYGLSQVTVVFEDGTDIYFARQQVAERLQQVKSQLPAGLEPELGPDRHRPGRDLHVHGRGGSAARASPTARRGPPTDLRTLQDWVVRPQLRNDARRHRGQHHRRLRAADPHHAGPGAAGRVRLHAARRGRRRSPRNNQNVGAGYIERNGQQFLVRVPGQVADLERARRHRARPARRRADPRARRRHGRRRPGAAHRRGDAERPEVVLGTVFMLIGENSRAVARAAAARVEEVQKSLPPGVTIERGLRPHRAGRSHHRHGANNLVEGALLVIAVLFLLLGNFRAALITAAVIPLSMLFTVTGMVRGGVSGNLMSLGALDFGLIVDGAVIIIENCLRRFGEEQRALGRVLTARSASSSPRRATRRSDPAEPVRRRHHHRGLPADLRAHRHRGKDVPPDGDHRGAGADRARCCCR